ncbi:polynucleotide adenylyltransferase PcnB [Methylibium rhizosphaerae]|uniref:polynucleotide adenylyltransferase PcnB n=1 Tax=Methylibium rhizosphaerae TaxID=2570323 RepID=UPI001127A028|nr:polynucleotide adenylyltransferase PcnB [Methylibium rhizosphaerae]
MIKKFIDKLLGKNGSNAAGGPKKVSGKRVEVGKAEHGIDPALVDERAVKVVATLKEAGHEAYIVGGAVRDLLLGLRPKDFDVATNATPEQVKALFRRAFIIGRRFRIVHVVFGRGREHEVIEVSTFRAYLDNAAAEQVEGNEKTSKQDLVGKSHVVDASGRVLRDNVWGPQIEDAARRDFTVNALYYDPQTEIVVDYHGGIKDAKKRVLRMIGDPVTRYREDPVRIIRVVRFAAKLGFEIEPKTRAPIKEMAALLDNVPQSRLFDEMIKLLQTGHALASLEELRKQGLHRGVFPVLDVVLDEAHRHDGREKFVQLALADTDRRVNEDKPVAPSFMLASMLWHDVQKRWEQLKKKGEPPFPALQQAIDEVFNARIGDISGRGKLAADMREIWMMQPRFDRRTGSGPASLVEQPRFRAGFDFLRLRADAGEADPELARWWEAFSLASPGERHALVDQARQQEHARRVAAGPDASAPAAKKRRRRRRKPAVEGGGSADVAPAGGDA